MDMVRSSVEDIGGKILIDSTVGEGSKFVLIIPIPRSVLIIKSLMIDVSCHKFCIPLESVAEVVNFDQNNEDTFHEVEGAILLKHHGELIPLVPMRCVLGLGEQEGKVSNIVIVKGDGIRYGIIVDKIHDIEEVVSKNLVQQLKKIGCYVGATLVGEGEMAMILDLLGLAQLAGIGINNEDNEFADYLLDKNIDTDQREFMQFDFTSRSHYAIPLEDVSRLEEFKTSDVEFSGDIALIRYRGDFLPLVFLEECLEFGNTKQKYLAEHESLPIIVVNFENKNYGFVVGKIGDIGTTDSKLNNMIRDREGISGSVFISDKTISVIDTGYITKNYKKIRPVEKEIPKKELDIAA